MFFFCAVCVVFPVAVWAFMFFRFNDLDNQRTLTRFGSLYERFDLRTGKVLAAVPALYLLRRLTLAAAVTLSQSFIVQLLTFYMGIVAQFSILGLQPHIESRTTCKYKPTPLTYHR